MQVIYDGLEEFIKWQCPKTYCRKVTCLVWEVELDVISGPL